jgi:hypothetical protein
VGGTGEAENLAGADVDIETQAGDAERVALHPRADAGDGGDWRFGVRHDVLAHFFDDFGV